MFLMKYEKGYYENLKIEIYVKNSTFFNLIFTLTFAIFMFYFHYFKRWLLNLQLIFIKEHQLASVDQGDCGGLRRRPLRRLLARRRLRAGTPGVLFFLFF